MTNNNKGESIEDAACRLLAEGWGYGSCWDADEDRHAKRRGMYRSAWAQSALSVVSEGHPEEQARLLVSKDLRKAPPWFKGLYVDEQDMVAEWAHANPLQAKRRQLGEFAAWSTGTTVSVPKAAHGERAGTALADAKLAGPLEPLLRLVALEDERQAETVVRYLVMAGHRHDVACTALYRLIHARPKTRSFMSKAERARLCHMRAQDHARLEDAAHAQLREWLHRASTGFLRAHGYRPRRRLRSVTLKATTPKRAPPRFMGGMDTWAA